MENRIEGTMMADTERLSSAITRELEGFGLELEDLDLVGGGKRRKLRVIVDGEGPQGQGPLVDDIAEAARAISSMLDADGLMGEQPYELEVSSRGTSRPLTAPKHWRRNQGRLVRCQMQDSSSVVGRIARSDDEGAELTVTVDAKRGTTESVRVEYAEINKATIEVELSGKAAKAGKDG